VQKPSDRLITVALIGSFRRYYSTVLDVIDLFNKAGILISTPKGTPIIEPGIPFVRFTSDPSQLADYMVQTLTMERIFKADLTYVIAQDSYIGKTTCYEIGRIIQSGHPIYFSNYPQDLPINIPQSFILAPNKLVEKINSGTLLLQSFYKCYDDEYSRKESKLIDE